MSANSTNNSNESVFWAVTACSICNAFIPVVVSLFLQAFMDTSSSKVDKIFRRQLSELKAEIRSVNMVDEFAKYARVQRKIATIEDKLSSESTLQSTCRNICNYVICGILHTVNGIALFAIMWFYSYEPLLKFPSYFFFPIGYFLSIPCGESGIVGITSWLVIVNNVSRMACSSLSIS